MSQKEKSGKIGDLMAMYHRESLWFRLTHFPIRKGLKLMLLLNTIPNKRASSRSRYLEYLYMVMAYHYMPLQNNIELLVVDHGLAQQLGSMLHDVNFKWTEKMMRRLASLVKSMDSLSMVYCQIPVAVTLERMRMRKRDIGRIDAVMNDTEKVLALLNNEQQLFDRIYNCVPNVKPLNMNQPVVQIEERLSEII